MKTLFLAKLKVDRETATKPSEKMHLIEAKDETEARKKLDEFYAAKSKSLHHKLTLRSVDIEEIIK